ncbi:MULTISPECIES: DUF2189 domain-containing protein [unclassified Mesorhizobium]|uniref:DUF2189 domain-containing protein n=1 Tax=unclassified Mesorhizobium TaxID=325217 RepID=UPI00112D29A5|nr:MULTISPECIES: DUF2189 domain-containing protein [unclassified Mesorhizobium]MBZ9700505.1 DUF2189 domain-containing protein [Mesorhizobium sp. CO1-1-3]MBZ9895122.1 DUF2189 domain-containing protein [Mesorhizobium sp. BR1-1-6]MBZ9946441.1 DUF2189 domain-containing protein [Mesorhizobium sp. BR1-1-11]MBZ9958138.1 DUF2189 domain-containing protein [Mesorhizobium sp. BR1-1-14]MCA0057639.1 DUF2189 domain-containing protein [Mesorhizobium sp. B261B1A]
MASFHVIAGASETLEHTRIRKIGVTDLFDALRRGVDDFMVKPSHIIFLCLIYPLAGVVLAVWTSGNNTLPLLFPLVSGFALIGPFAAIGLYEISRRREAGLDASWRAAFEVRNSPALPAIAAVAIMLLAIFIAWLLTAQAFYQHLFGPAPPQSFSSFINDIFATGRGWTLIILGHAIGFVFAAIVLCTTVVAFPLLLERDVGAYEAIHTSVRVVLANPIVMAVWGLIVAVALIIGTLPVFAGLAVVLPILGHATWHVYRKVVEPPPTAGPAPR